MLELPAPPKPPILIILPDPLPLYVCVVVFGFVTGKPFVYHLAACAVFMVYARLASLYLFWQIRRVERHIQEVKADFAGKYDYLTRPYSDPATSVASAQNLRAAGIEANDAASRVNQNGNI